MLLFILTKTANTRMLIILTCNRTLRLLAGGKGYKTSLVMPEHNKLGCSCQLSLKLQARPGASTLQHNGFVIYGKWSD
jgi:hypothetical protein